MSHGRGWNCTDGYACQWKIWVMIQHRTDTGRNDLLSNRKVERGSARRKVARASVCLIETERERERERERACAAFSWRECFPWGRSDQIKGWLLISQIDLIGTFSRTAGGGSGAVFQK